ncbi:flavin monoamine oxidase family protein [Pseudemcibacter aquimaris]|uniref:flavin monoamine oxidase family protein n=1 Tax=Pseudemcibacter aquimaris TaxID=2857064 RepID=UPI0020131CAC|nr:FAD-dependent oxidoreductase [Pseudemcibacter aquimaris]MCC3859645.1 FAD-dependent oxidoreductase [Pseudemcibacter aquimaris]WDU60040.1 FAD-dependent oxidoreductase [Pseudemcibacter aquimaris]
MTENNNSFTKRDFLTRIGMMAGTSAMMSTMAAWDRAMASTMTEPPKMTTDGNGKKVLVLGAGISGLVCALELTKKGYDVQILEAKDHVGGRCMSARKGTVIEDVGGERQVCDFDNNQYLNVGPWRIAPEHHSTIYYCKKLGIELEPFVNKAFSAYYYQSKGEGPLVGKSLRQNDVDTDRTGYVAELLAKCVNDGFLDERVTKEDQERILEYLKATGLIDRRELNYRANLARGYENSPSVGTDLGKLADPYELSDLLKFKMGTRHIDRDHPAMMFQPKGGMDQIPFAMADALPKGIIRLNSEITEIKQSDSSVSVTYKDTKSGREETVTADYAISCLMFPTLNKIKTDFREDVVAGLRAPTSAPIVKNGLQFSQRFWENEEQIYGGITANDFEESGEISYPSDELFSNSTGVLLTSYARRGGAIKLGNKSIKDRFETSLEIGEKIHPGYFRKYYNGKGVSMAWHKQKYALAAWVVWSKRNITRRFPALIEGEKRVLFSGNGMVPMHRGWIFAAIESAWHSIDDLDKRVSKG